MRAWNDKQWSIVLAAVIEVGTQRDHVFQERERRLDVNQTGLRRPRSEACRLYPGADSDRAILVPDQSPIRPRPLVEENCADGARAIAKLRTGDHVQRAVTPQQSCQRRVVDQPRAGTVVEATVHEIGEQAEFIRSHRLRKMLRAFDIEAQTVGRGRYAGLIVLRVSSRLRSSVHPASSTSFI